MLLLSFVVSKGICSPHSATIVAEFEKTSQYARADEWVDFILGDDPPLHLRLPQSYVVAIWKNRIGEATQIMLEVPLQALNIVPSVGPAGQLLPTAVVDIAVQTKSNKLSGQKLLDAMKGTAPSLPVGIDDAGYEIYRRQGIISPFNELHVRTFEGNEPLFVLCDDYGSVPNPMCVTNFEIGKSTAEQIIVRRKLAITAKSVLLVTQKAKELFLSFVRK